jgi:hypothetical protein
MLFKFPQGIRMKNLLIVVAFLGVIPGVVWATGSVSPDPVLVSRYSSNKNELNAKLAACKKLPDIAAVLADVGCVSAQTAVSQRQKKMIDTKCSSADTFVFVPPGMHGDELKAYLLAHAPSSDVLSQCGQTQDQWVRSHLAGNAKK